MSADHLFASLVPLDRDRHRQLRLQSPAEECLGAGQNVVYCAAAEFAQACKEFVLLFVHSGETDEQGLPLLNPVCLLGLQPGENLFIQQGRWRARYRPAYLRRYPLAMAQVAEGSAKRAALAIDASYPGLSPAAQGVPAFDAEGEPTAVLREAMGLAQDFEAAVAQTRSIGGQLYSLGLLKEMRAEGALADGQRFVIDGFWVVDEARLQGLPADALYALHRSGLLALIHAHLISLSNLQRLVDWRNQG